jgi:hypothetical protein
MKSASAAWSVPGKWRGTARSRRASRVLAPHPVLRACGEERRLRAGVGDLAPGGGAHPPSRGCGRGRGRPPGAPPSSPRRSRSRPPGSAPARRRHAAHRHGRGECVRSAGGPRGRGRPAPRHRAGRRQSAAAGALGVHRLAEGGRGAGRIAHLAPQRADLRPRRRTCGAHLEPPRPLFGHAERSPAVARFPGARRCARATPTRTALRHAPPAPASGFRPRRPPPPRPSRRPRESSPGSAESPRSPDRSSPPLPPRRRAAATRVPRAGTRAPGHAPRDRGAGGVDRPRPPAVRQATRRRRAPGPAGRPKERRRRRGEAWRSLRSAGSAASMTLVRFQVCTNGSGIRERKKRANALRGGYTCTEADDPGGVVGAERRTARLPFRFSGPFFGCAAPAAAGSSPPACGSQSAPGERHQRGGRVSAGLSAAEAEQGRRVLCRGGAVSQHRRGGRGGVSACGGGRDHLSFGVRSSQCRVYPSTGHTMVAGEIREPNGPIKDYVPPVRPVSFTSSTAGPPRPSHHWTAAPGDWFTAPSFLNRFFRIRGTSCASRG